MKRILTAAALALLSSTAALADNNTTQLYTGGYWSAYHVARNGAGKPMCGVSGSWTFAGGVKGWLTMKYSNENGLFMHFSKDSWSFEPELSVPLAISFDTGYREGTGISATSPQTGRPIIESSIPADAAPGFLEDFANAKVMTITFKEGNERPWIANMTGSRGAVKALGWCMTKITAVASSPVAPKASSPVGQQATSPVKPTLPMPPVQPTDDRKRATKDDGNV